MALLLEGSQAHCIPELEECDQAEQSQFLIHPLHTRSLLRPSIKENNKTKYIYTYKKTFNIQLVKTDLLKQKKGNFLKINKINILQ